MSSSDSSWITNLVAIVGGVTSSLAVSYYCQSSNQSKRTEAIKSARQCTVEDLPDLLSNNQSANQYVAIRGVTHSPEPILTKYSIQPIPCVQVHVDRTDIYSSLNQSISLFRPNKIIHQSIPQQSTHHLKDFVLKPANFQSNNQSSSALTRSLNQSIYQSAKQPNLIVPYNLPVDASEVSTLIHPVSSATIDQKWPASLLIDRLIEHNQPALTAQKYVERAIECDQPVTAVGFVNQFNGDYYLVPSTDSAVSRRLHSELVNQPKNQSTHIDLNGKISGTLHTASKHSHHPIIITSKTINQLIADEEARLSKLKQRTWIVGLIGLASVCYVVARYAQRRYNRWLEVQRMLMFTELRRQERERRLTRNKSRQSINNQPNSAPISSSQEQDEGQPIEQSDRLCVLCLSCDSNALLLECGHCMTCMDCADRLQICPICRQTITRRVRVYA